MYNLQNGVTTAAMTDQEMEDLDSQLEVHFFQSISRGFLKPKQAQLPAIQRFLSHSMK